MKARKEVITYRATRRMVEGGQIYPEGSHSDLQALDYDRLVFVLARGFFVPLGGLDSLPEEFFLDVMEAID